ncbi:MAG: S41 family peptidase [Bacteroidales bacterium]|nr:S41 family peptidase [Bacteroidales bacterium]
MRKLITIFLVAAMTAGTAIGQETPKWIRKNSISPDGTKIAFSYKGDIFVVPATGGTARQITTNAAYDSEPLWTADGKNVVFSSYREKSKDIFVTSSEGGTPKRLTFHPGNETPLAVLADGKVVFSANIEQDALFDGFPGDAQLYYTDLNGSRPVRITSLPIDAISISNDGTIIYEDVKGYEDQLRKHHTSPVTKDIWSYKGSASTGKLSIDGNGTFKQLSDYKGEDRNPVFAADGDTFYYLSERDGKAMNVYRSSLSAPGKSVQLTHFTQNPARYLSVAKNGTLAFSYNGDLYTLKEGSEPKKVDIKVYSDQDERDVETMTLSGGATYMDVSRSQKEIALVIRGDVFVTSADYKTTKRITNTASQERNVSFSEDGRTLYYSAERDGHWGIWRTSLVNKEDKYFTYATEFKEELFSDEGETCFQPVVSPDGKYVAYLRDRTELVIKPTKGGKTISLIKDANYSYADGDLSFSWSPDSHYLLSSYQADGGWNNEDIAVVDIDTKEITDLTQSGYSDGSFRWALGGKAMTWESDKDGYRSHGSWGAEGDIYIMFFDGKAMTEFFRDKEDAEIAKMLAGDDKKDAKKDEKDEKKDSVKKVEKLKLDLENRADRVFRLTRNSGRIGSHLLTDDGKKLLYTVRLESGFDLCSMDIEEGNVKVLKKSVYGFIPSPDGKYIYISSGMGITKMSVNGGESKNISFAGEFEFKPKAEREYIFEHMWKQVQEKFYDPDLHGVDWNYYKENYAQFLPYINNNFDFQELLSEILGELNGSHTGGRYSYRSGLTMGTLGVIFDGTYEGDGLKIKEVLPDGALSLADPEIKAGDIIVSINGNEIKAGKDWYQFLTDRAGKKTPICVKKGGKKATDLFVEPGYSDYSLLYKRWVKEREAKVKKLSGGKIGYVHVEGMNSPSFREVYSKALGKYRTADALIVDTRHNGGGWLHDDLVTFLGGRDYVNYQPRGKFIGKDPYSKWSKPSCVLVCEDNYSDACGFPYAYKALKIGKLIGAPVAGTMTAVWWETQINPNIIFGIPQVGSWCIDEGHYSENHQVDPDILVYNDPASVLRGEDKQLEAAVKEMLAETKGK